MAPRTPVRHGHLLISWMLSVNDYSFIKCVVLNMSLQHQNDPAMLPL